MKNKKMKFEKKKEGGSLSHFFSHFSVIITKVTGSVYAFITAIAIVIIWAVTGPIFKFSDTWQLVINTGTTIVTFLMVFIIQHSQNKDTVAIQLKLDELLASSHSSNKMIGAEDLSEEELAELKKFFVHLTSISKNEKENKIHTIDEAIPDSLNTPGQKKKN
jgi:low affinity Fe/Cu permease